MREAYGCDCDGTSHRSASLTIDPRYSGTVRGVRSFRKVIKDITGIEPESCPWRAFYHPLVREVLQLATLASERSIGLLGADPPAILVEAFEVYTRARAQTSAHFLRQRTEELRKKKPPRK